jgi:hypothetical protein
MHPDLPDHPDHPEQRQRPLDPRAGLPNQPTRPAGISFAIGLGGFWGFVGYAILWQGIPVQVDRSFVESVAGTLTLLPVRIVIWAIHEAEIIAGRSFDLSQNNVWIAFVAGGVGALIASGLFLLGRGASRRIRHARP